MSQPIAFSGGRAPHGFMITEYHYTHGERQLILMIGPHKGFRSQWIVDAETRKRLTPHAFYSPETVRHIIESPETKVVHQATSLSFK